MRDIFRERTIILALVLQLFIAAFSSFLLVGLVGLYDPDQAESRVDSRVAYVGPGPFGAFLRRESSLTVLVTDQATALRLFDQGRVDAVIEEIYERPDQSRIISLLLPEGELQTTLIVTLLKDHLKDYERALREAREAEIQTTVVYVDAPAASTPFFAFAYSLLVPLLLIVPAFLSGAIAADAVTQEVETRTLELLRSSPAGSRGIYAGKVVAPILLSPIQGLLWILLFQANGIRIHNPLPILILLTAITTFLVAGAVLFALALRTQGDAQIAYSLFVLLFLGVTQVLPQPLLTAFARLGVGSLTGLELATILGAVAFAVIVLLVGRQVAPRLIQRLQ